MFDIFEKEKEVLISTYKRFPIVIEKGENSILFSKDGKKYIDFTSGIGVNSIGYGNRKWAEAVYKQSLKLAHISNLYYTEPQINLAEKLVKISGMSKMFFANSGAEANEGALKIARKYSFDKYGSNRHKVISLKNSFHGRTLFSLEATGQTKMHEKFYPLTNGFYYVDANNYEDFRNNLNEDVCAIIMESVQGEGGLVPLEKDFVLQIYNICKEKDILIIFDEVQTGIGRTGKFFGFENYNVCPDIITMAKGLGGGLPIGGFLVNEKLEKVFCYKDHGTTFGGNPVCCAGANIVIDIINNEIFLKEVIKKGNYIKEKIKSYNSNIIRDIRGIGLMIGIEIKDFDNMSLINKCLENGLLVLPAGQNVVRFLPPLTINYQEIDEGLEILKNILEGI